MKTLLLNGTLTLLCFSVCTSMIAAEPTDPNSREAKAYKSLLAKPHFYESKDTKVRDLKYLASLALITLCEDMLADNATTRNLSSDTVAGLEKLKTFAYAITNKLGTLSNTVSLASLYIFEFCKIGTSHPYPGQMLKRNYFDSFNRLYTPIIEAIMQDYKRKTALPIGIDWDEINAWGTLQQFKSIKEPGI